MLNISHTHCKQELKLQTCCSECECVHLEKCSQYFGFVKSALALTEGATCHAHCTMFEINFGTAQFQAKTVQC